MLYDCCWDTLGHYGTFFILISILIFLYISCCIVILPTDRLLNVLKSCIRLYAFIFHFVLPFVHATCYMEMYMASILIRRQSSGYKHIHQHLSVRWARISLPLLHSTRSTRSPRSRCTRVFKRAESNATKDRKRWVPDAKTINSHRRHTA